MKISILSMQRVVNFGSVLQGYSLRQILRELTQGQVEFMDIQSECVPVCRTVAEQVDYEAPADYPPGLLQKGKRWMITRLSRRNKQYIRDFMTRELELDQPSDGKAPDFVIVGSDEVFNHAGGVKLQLHGDISGAKKVFTYAAACGSAKASDIAPEDREKVRQKMANFSAVSVRDGATQAYAQALYEGEIVRHLDPVLVGDLAKRPHKKVPIKNYLLVYAYGQRIRTKEEIQAIRKFAEAKKLKTVALGGSQFWCDYYIPASPFRMLDYFYHARYVVTDTFHGAVFSIIHHKQFAVIPRKTNRNKLTGLLEDLALTERMAENMDSLPEVLEKPIDCQAVEAILEREKARTRAYLKDQLGV